MSTALELYELMARLARHPLWTWRPCSVVDVTEHEGTMVPLPWSWATVGQLLGMLVVERGGTFWRAMDDVEAELGGQEMPGGEALTLALARALASAWGLQC